MAECNYLNDWSGRGKMDANMRTPLLAQFDASGYREFDDVDWSQVHAFIEATMDAVPDPRRRLDISYAATAKLIEDWQLLE
jgi:hypothetical protein